MSTPTSPVVYVALGTRRTRAAREYASRLAAAGAPVHLVVADRPEWTTGDIAGVTLYRVATLREARRLLLNRRGPLAGARLLVTGDPESTPLAEPARRRFPNLSVCLEPSAEGPPAEGLPAVNRPPAADVAVVTPWYPSPNDPEAGAAVRTATGALVGRVVTLHAENWLHAPKGIAGKLVGVTLGREVARTGGAVVEDDLIRVVIPQTTGSGHAQRVRAQIARLRTVLPGGRIDAPLIHAHTGHHGGVIAAALARDDARIVLTEYAESLAEVAADRTLAAAYREMLARVDRVLGDEPVQQQFAELFPEYVNKLQGKPAPEKHHVPAPRPPVPAPGTDRVVVVAIDSGRTNRVADYVDGARAKGYAVDLIAHNPAKWSQYATDAGVRIFDIGRVEHRHLTRKLQRGLITTLPRRALGFVRARTKALRSPLPEAVTIYAQRGHSAVARAIDGRVYEPFYRLIRPRILWGITRRAVVPTLDLPRTRAVVVHGLPGVATGWGLARRDPAMAVMTDLTPPSEQAGIRP